MRASDDPSLTFALMVSCAPDAQLLARHAVLFANTVVAAGHRLGCVFFYADGAATGLRGIQISSDDFNAQRGWQDLASRQAVELCICVGSAQRRGISEAAGSVASGFTVTGLGRWLECLARADRNLRFGP